MPHGREVGGITGYPNLSRVRRVCEHPAGENARPDKERKSSLTSQRSLTTGRLASIAKKAISLGSTADDWGLRREGHPAINPYSKHICLFPEEVEIVLGRSP